MRIFYKVTLFTILAISDIVAFSQTKIAIYNGGSNTQMEYKVFAVNLINSCSNINYGFEASDKSPNINYLLRNQGYDTQTKKADDGAISLVCEKLEMDYVINYTLFTNKTIDNVSVSLINAKTFVVDKTLTLTCRDFTKSTDIKAITDEIANTFFYENIIAEIRAKEERELAEQKAEEQKGTEKQRAKEEKALAEQKALEEKKAAEQTAKEEKALAEQKAKEEKKAAELKAKEEKEFEMQKTKSEKAIADSLAKEIQLEKQQKAKEERQLKNQNLNGHYFSFGSSISSSGYYGIGGLGYEYRYHILGVNISAGYSLDVFGFYEEEYIYLIFNTGFKLYLANKKKFARNLYFNFLPFSYFGKLYTETTLYEARNNYIQQFTEHHYKNMFGMGLFFGYSPVWAVNKKAALGIDMSVGIKTDYQFEHWLPLNWNFGFIVKF